MKNNANLESHTFSLCIYSESVIRVNVFDELFFIVDA